MKILRPNTHHHHHHATPSSLFWMLSTNEPKRWPTHHFCNRRRTLQTMATRHSSILVPALQRLSGEKRGIRARDLPAQVRLLQLRSSELLRRISKHEAIFRGTKSKTKKKKLFTRSDGEAENQPKTGDRSTGMVRHFVRQTGSSAVDSSNRQTDRQ